MAARVLVYDVTCPASTPASAPIETQAYSGGNFTVTAVTILIPDGHLGTTGIALGFAHNPVIPENPGAFISGNDEILRYTLSAFPPGAPWSVFTCNTDSIPHSWETRWELDILAATTATGRQLPLSPSDIYQAAA